jgi:hypothetical protein
MSKSKKLDEAEALSRMSPVEAYLFGRLVTLQQAIKNFQRDSRRKGLCVGQRVLLREYVAVLKIAAEETRRKLYEAQAAAEAASEDNGGEPREWLH